MDGRSGGGGQGPGALRARDVAPELRAVLPHQEPAPLGEGDQAARPPELVRGAAAGRQRDPARGAALHHDPDGGPGQPGALRQVRGELPQEGRRGGPVHREAGPPVHARIRPDPAARGPGGPAHHPHGPDPALAHPLRELHRGGQDAPPRDPAQPHPGHAHRQEVQARARPDHERGPRLHHPRHRRPDRPQARRARLPGAVPPPALPGICGPRTRTGSRTPS